MPASGDPDGGHSPTRRVQRAARPPARARVVPRLNLPLEPKLRELSPVQLDVLQAVLNSPSLDVVFDSVPSTDLEAAQAVLFLLQRGYLVSED